MSKTSTKVTLVGALILLTVFGYSWLANTAGRTGYIASDNGEEVVRELMPGMSEGSTGMMDYQDGAYTATVNYEIPYGYVEPMEVTLKIEDNTVIDVQAAFEVINPVSEGYQQAFLEYVPREVVGRKVDNVSLSRMTGASLTNRAFDAALVKIKAEAAGMPTMDWDGVVPMQLPGMSDSENTQVIAFKLPPTPSVDTSEFVINSVTEAVELDDTVYTVDHSYTVNPFLTEPMWTTVTVKDNVIADVSVAFNSLDQISIMHQEVFVDQYRDEIIGQPIETASLSRVSYASLTTKAFNDALEAVREKRTLNDV